MRVTETLDCIKIILTFENLENFEAFADLFLNLIKDEDYRVRLHMSHAITVFFELFEDEAEILRDINKHIPSNFFVSKNFVH